MTNSNIMKIIYLIIGCGNEKSLQFLKSCKKDIGELWPSAKHDEGPNCGILRVLVLTPIKDKVVFTYSKAQNKEFGSEE